MFRVYFTPKDVDRELDEFRFPDDFVLGCSTAGYQVEGGFNGEGDPKNNWYWAERKGQKARTGACCRFLDLYEEDLDRARAIGLSSSRMGIEWARLQPSADPGQTRPPDFSTDAARLYARIIAAGYDRGIFPAVTLHHFTNPLWAGLDFWLDRGKVRELFPAYVEWAVRTINKILIDEFRKEPIPYYITINEPIALPMTGYLLGVFPRGEAGGGWRNALVCYENLLFAHVLAYRTVHRIYREEGWKTPTVTVNCWSAGIYAMDKLVQDLVVLRQNNIPRSGVRGFLDEQRDRFRAQMRRVPYIHGPQFVKRAVDGLLDRAFWRRLDADPMPALVDLILEGEEPSLVDAVGFDFYDPFVANNLDLGSPRLLGIRKQPWEWHVNPRALPFFLESYAWNAGDLPIHMLENGMSYRRVGTRCYPRPDGARRIDVLKATFFEIVRSLNRGIALRAYYYWSLIDNYEWGSFEPRFGLFAVDYEDGARRLPTDAAGDNAAGAYSLFVRAFREKDKELLREALTATRYPDVLRGA